MTDHIIAVDLGGTQVRAALCDTEGHIIKRAAVAAQADEGVEAVFTRIVATIRQVMSEQVRCIGVGAPGPLDPWRGIVLESPNLPGMINFPMKARLEAEFRVPTFAGHDANIAALGEHRYGAGRGVAHLIYVTISTGIGGGIIINNQLHLGWRGFAGEVGHQTLDANGPLCNCGNIGCLEVLAAGPAIERAAQAALYAGRESKMRALVNDDLTQVRGKIIAQAARDGDALAQEIYARTGFYIGLGLINLLHSFDTELFVLGGGVAIHTWDLLYPQITATLNRHAFASMSKGVRIVPAQLGDDVGLLGAVALVLNQTAV